MMHRLILPSILAVASAVGAADDPVNQLEKCPESDAATPVGWNVVVAPDKDIAFALPPGFEEATDPPFFVHGGVLWNGPQIQVSVTYGHWGLSSFDLGKDDRVCRTTINGIPAVLIATSGDGWHSLSAWVRTGAEVYEPVLGVTFDRGDDAAVAKHVIASVRRTSDR